MNITVVGLGYVGLANAAALSRQHDVIALDIDLERVLTVNSAHSPFEDAEMDEWLTSQPLRIWATDDRKVALRGRDCIVIAVPTNYVEETGEFDTSIVERVLYDAVLYSPKAAIVIRSTVPVGFTKRMAERHPDNPIMFVPEFLREGKALLDTLNPSRIIIGASAFDEREANAFGQALDFYAGQGYTVMNPTEAEAVKLFSNTYLAMRVAFFNELDTFSMAHTLDSAAVIRGLEQDPRIGRGYDNPSFGYGGYCLPKDTKQLRANFGDVPQRMMSAIIESNDIRKSVITNEIGRAAASVGASTVGIFRLTMKAGSDNFRDSAVLDMIPHLRAYGLTVLVYEPELAEPTFDGDEVVGDLDEFTARSDLIVANRYDDRLSRVREKVYTRDIFQRD